MIWGYGFGAIAVLFFMATHERARAIPSPGITLVILVPLVLLVDRLAGYHPPPIKGRPGIFWGLSIFFLTFSYDRLSHLWMGCARAVSEPFRFPILTICLCYVVSPRVCTTRAEWSST